MGAREALERAVEEYNRYRRPEAVARLLRVEGDEALLEFTGSFCETCGVYDWLEDFVYEVRDLNLGLDAEIEACRRLSDDAFLVKIRLRQA